MDPQLAPPQAAFPFRVVALPSRDLHRRLPEIAQADDVVIIDTPQLEDHAAIALSALRYADQIVIPCAPSPIEINRTTPVREEITEVVAARDRPARSAVLLNRCVARAHSTADAREALASLDYDVLGTAVPRLEVYAQSFGRPVPGTGRQVWRGVARDLIERCPPPCAVQSGSLGHHPAQTAQNQPRPESRALSAAHARTYRPDQCAPPPRDQWLPRPGCGPACRRPGHSWAPEQHRDTFRQAPAVAGRRHPPGKIMYLTEALDAHFSDAAKSAWHPQPPQAGRGTSSGPDSCPDQPRHGVCMSACDVRKEDPHRRGNRRASVPSSPPRQRPATLACD